MDELFFSLVGFITGIIGTLTGVISLVWHINKNRAKLRLESVYFGDGGFSSTQARAYKTIGVRVRLKNLGAHPTTISDIWVAVGNIHQQVPFFKPVDLPPGGFKELEYELKFDKNEFKKLFAEKGLLNFEFFLKHTFGKIRRKSKTKFPTGHFTMR